MNEAKNKLEELEQAKTNMLTCFNDSNCLVGMHGLAYWAKRVESLRAEIKKAL